MNPFVVAIVMIPFLVSLGLTAISVAIAWRNASGEPLVAAVLFATLSAASGYLLVRMSRRPLLEFPGSEHADRRLVRFATVQVLVVAYVALGAALLALASVESARYWIGTAAFFLGTLCLAAAGHREYVRVRASRTENAISASTDSPTSGPGLDGRQVRRARAFLTSSVAIVALVGYLVVRSLGDRAPLSGWDVAGVVYFGAGVSCWFVAITRQPRTRRR